MGGKYADRDGCFLFTKVAVNFNAADGAGVTYSADGGGGTESVH